MLAAHIGDDEGNRRQMARTEQHADHSPCETSHGGNGGAPGHPLVYRQKK